MLNIDTKDIMPHAKAAGEEVASPAPSRSHVEGIGRPFRQAWKRLIGHLRREWDVRHGSVRAEFRCRCVNDMKGYWFEARIRGRYDAGSGTMTVAASDIPHGKHRVLDMKSGKVISLRDGNVLADAERGDVIVLQGIRTKFL